MTSWIVATPLASTVDGLDHLRASGHASAVLACVCVTFSCLRQRRSRIQSEGYSSSIAFRPWSPVKINMRLTCNIPMPFDQGNEHPHAGHAAARTPSSH